MDDESDHRIANNEALFRDVNEAIEAGHWPGEEDALVAFRCECAELGCSRLIELSPRDYERVRQNPRRFVVAPDHDVPGLETVIETHEDWVVVEKREEAGTVAEATDPRD